MQQQLIENENEWKWILDKGEKNQIPQHLLTDTRMFQNAGREYFVFFFKTLEFTANWVIQVGTDFWLKTCSKTWDKYVEANNSGLLAVQSERGLGAQLVFTTRVFSTL